MFCCNLQYFQITIFSIQIYLLQITQTISLSQIALPHHPSHKRRHQRAPPKLFPQIWSLIFLEHSYFLFPHIFLDWAFAWVHRNGVFKSSAFPNYNTCLALMGFDVYNKPIKAEWVAFSRISSKIEFYISCLAWPVDENLAWQIYQWVTDSVPPQLKERLKPAGRGTKQFWNCDLSTDEIWPFCQWNCIICHCVVLHRDAKSGRCGRYICAIFFSWC